MAALAISQPDVPESTQLQPADIGNVTIEFLSWELYMQYVQRPKGSGWGIYELDCIAPLTPNAHWLANSLVISAEGHF